MAPVPSRPPAAIGPDLEFPGTGSPRPRVQKGGSRCARQESVHR